MSIISNGMISPNVEGAEAKEVKIWLAERLSEFEDLLCGLLRDEETSLRVCSFS
jgi:hypothetical protein